MSSKHDFEIIILNFIAMYTNKMKVQFLENRKSEIFSYVLQPFNYNNRWLLVSIWRLTLEIK